VSLTHVAAGRALHRSVVMPSNSSLFQRPLRTACAWLFAALLGVACGGGGGDSANAGGTAFTAGTITGFGSTIVNGVRFEDSRARVLDDDDQAHDRGELKLGMSAEVESDRVHGDNATARQIRFGAEIVGPVEKIDAPNKQLTALGQTIDVGDTTVFDDSSAGGLAALAVGAVVEVHAQFDAATGHYKAKRIERKAQVNFYRLRGVITDIDTGRETFTIGGATISYAGIAPASLPANLAKGAPVRVRLQTTQATPNVWTAVSVRSGVRKVEDHDEAHLRGTITGFTDTASFSVDGMPVTTGATTAFPDGTAGILLGAEVEVEGAIANGVLAATKVELEDRHQGDDNHLIELHGTVSAPDAKAQTFSVRNVSVHYGSATGFEHGSASDLVEGRPVEVKGSLAADGVTVEAVRIKLDD
jgi:hypothetical protein